MSETSETNALQQHPLNAVDYVIVGGGSSGCVAAGVLAENPDRSVLILESGPAAEENPETLTASGYKAAFMNDDIIWERFTEKQKGAANQYLFVGSGTGMGGSGAVNAMVYTRGSREDYDEWPKGWNWDDVTPHFEAVEERLKPSRRPSTNFTEVALNASKDAGFKISDDLNSGNMSGVMGYEWMNFHDEQRRHSYAVFVKEAAPKNLSVETGARVQRLLFDENKRIEAVVYRQNGEDFRIDVKREVLMCAGALETPKLLMLSGVGPKDELEAHDIDIVHEVPEIGQNLHDHPNVPIFFRGNHDVDLYHPQVYGFDRMDPQSDLPEGQSDTCFVLYAGNSSFYESSIRVVPYKLYAGPKYNEKKRARARKLVNFGFRRKFVKKLVSEMYGIVVILGKPKSRGTLGLKSTNAEDFARVDPNYLDDPADVRVMVEGYKRAIKMVQAPALAEWGNKPFMPRKILKDDAKIEKWIRKNLITTFHYAGTCRIGEDEGSVVDLQGRVRGLSGVRVADASIIPVTPVSALNAPSMMIGHRIATFVKEEDATH